MTSGTKFSSQSLRSLTQFKSRDAKVVHPYGIVGETKYILNTEYCLSLIFKNVFFQSSFLELMEHQLTTAMFSFLNCVGEFQVR